MCRNKGKLNARIKNPICDVNLSVFDGFCTKTQLRGSLDHTLSATLFVGPRQSRFVLKKIWVVTAPGGRHTQDIKLSLMGSK